ncbi:Uncharacterized conserved protein, DUF2147 family [Chitinophaga sp. YR573]|uniref:DUF2147 domain-containing protein n=1 Tax=Chitinophaga sp. YR573 TaxID=1881040 RepID=UPI0008C757DC|nr:DUF2147 domain-containing protein [Chitinophaga sp. YR573]SEW43771.1 Uncharacterized conserved protein, DUF2147 family [Chitinophaga sp. YR573]
MFKHFLITTAVLVFFSINSWAQQATLVGRWITPDKDKIEFYIEGQTITGKQISTETEKDKKNNNKIIATGLKATSPMVFEGTIIDPKDDKTYKGRFIMNEAGTAIELKVKWGLLSFNETWKRVK